MNNKDKDILESTSVYYSKTNNAFKKLEDSINCLLLEFSDMDLARSDLRIVKDLEKFRDLIKEKIKTRHFVSSTLAWGKNRGHYDIDEDFYYIKPLIELDYYLDEKELREVEKRFYKEFFERFNFYPQPYFEIVKGENK